MLHFRIAALLATATLAACATTPESLRGEFADTTPAQASTDAAPAAATTVRWGGPILSMNNTADQSCFEILSRPLDSQGRPKHVDQDQGRFLACYAGFLDPETYKPGRDVTVVGTATGTEVRKVGEFEYTYPKVSAQIVHLWKPRQQTATTTYVVDPFFYGPYPYYYPYYYRVYYVAPPREPGDPTGPQLQSPLQGMPGPSSITKQLPQAPGGRAPLGGVIRR